MQNTSNATTHAQAPLSADVLALLKSKELVIAELTQQIDSLKHQLEWFKRQMFGAKSERVVQNPSQLHLGEALPLPESVPEDRKLIPAHERRVAKKDLADDAGESLPFFDESRVPVEVIELPAPEQANLAADEYEIISHKATFKLAQRPSSYVVLKYLRPVIKINATQQLACAPAPLGVIEGSRADVSFAAGLVVDKCAYHLPLYRQHKRLEDGGFRVSRQWLTQIIQQVLELMRPIYQAQFDSIRQSRVITMDETSIKAGRMEGKMQTGYFWPVMGEHDEVCFPFFPTRGKQCVEEALGIREKNTVLLTDGYAAYASYAKKTGITHARCWVHARRQFFEAQASDPAGCAAALDYIRRLFDVDEDIQKFKLKAEHKRLHRLTHSKPILTEFYDWIDAQFTRQGLTPSDPFVHALGYARDHRVGLEVFLTDPDVPLSTNHIERTLRVIPMGKKNWLFCWTELGAEHIGIAQSLIATCRMHHIDPYTYFVDVLQRISQHPASKVTELTPRLWKEHFAANPLRSDVYAVGKSVRKDAA